MREKIVTKGYLPASTYWSRFVRTRVSRRGAVVGAAGTVMSAAFLAACGGDDDSSTASSGNQPTGSGATTAPSPTAATTAPSSTGATTAPSSGLITQPVESTARATRGGTMKDRTYADPPTLNPVRANSPLNAVAGHTYESLLRFKPGLMKPSDNEVIGQLAESWEWSPDGLQIILKLRPGTTWHDKQPVNGRPFDTEDVLFSWKLFESDSNARGSVANTVSPDAPVLNLEATDSSTIAINLQYPLSFAPGIFALSGTGYILMLPREADSQFDLKGDIIGTGPFVMSEYKPSVGFNFTRNPKYWDPDAALVDKIELPIIIESASALAQFKAGNMYTFGSYASGPKLPSEDILPLKNDISDVALYQSPLQNPQGLGNRVLAFGWLPLADGSTPFMDERVRQAVSMAINRDLFQDTFFNISKFEQAGLPVNTRWNTALLAETEGFWLIPREATLVPTPSITRTILLKPRSCCLLPAIPMAYRM